MDPERHFNTLDSGSLRNVFINELSLLYAAKSHLTESLPALIEQAAFQSLKNALKEDFEDTRKQLVYLKEIFTLLNESAINENCLGMKAITREAYSHVLFNEGKNYESDMSIIFYMGVIEHLQIGAGRMLKLITLNKNYLAYEQLVEETLDMAKDNANLFYLIADEYIKSN